MENKFIQHKLIVLGISALAGFTLSGISSCVDIPRVLANTTFNLPVTRSVCFNDVTVCLSYSALASITSTVQVVDGSMGYVVAVNGGSFTVLSNSSGVNLNPAANIGSFTVVFPSAPIEGQLVHLTTTHNIGAITLTASQTVNTPINNLNAGAHASYRFVSTGNYWVIDD